MHLEVFGFNVWSALGRPISRVFGSFSTGSRIIIYNIYVSKRDVSAYCHVLAVFKYTARIFNIFLYFWAKVVYAIGAFASPSSKALLLFQMCMHNYRVKRRKNTFSKKMVR
jgi:hypothetical protein